MKSTNSSQKDLTKYTLCFFFSSIIFMIGRLTGSNDLVVLGGVMALLFGGMIIMLGKSLNENGS